MSITPQTNVELSQLAAILLERDDFVICGHVSPDGDCLGSQLGLMHALRAKGKRATCILVKDEPVDSSLRFMPGLDELVPAVAFNGEAATFVAVDVPTRERINNAAAHLLDACSCSITIDHHAVDTRMTEYAYVDPDAASTTMIVWELVGLMNAERDVAIATCCYTGLVTDTGRFQYQNTTHKALSAAAAMVAAGANPSEIARCVFQNRSLPSVRLEAVAVERMHFGAEGAYALTWLEQGDFARAGATKADAEPIIDTLRSLHGVQVACVLRDQGDSVRGSFRAKDATDVAELARGLGGGGHRAAAGFTLSGSVDSAVKQIVALLDEALVSPKASVACESASCLGGEYSA